MIFCILLLWSAVLWCTPQRLLRLVSWFRCCVLYPKMSLKIQKKKLLFNLVMYKLTFYFVLLSILSCRSFYFEDLLTSATISTSDRILIIKLLFCINMMLFSGTSCVCRVWAHIHDWTLWYDRNASLSFQYEWWFWFWRRAGEGNRYSMNIDVIFDGLINWFTLWEQTWMWWILMAQFRQVHCSTESGFWPETCWKLTCKNGCSLFKISHNAIQ